MRTAPSLAEAGFRPEEAKAVAAALGRAPNDVETAMLKVLWSEHCSYKHTRALLGTLPGDGPAVAVGPGQNAGALRVGRGFALAAKVESHNHPSAIEPFQGAATGLGGILRDVLATGARPIAFLDALFFAPGEAARFHRQGVVAGIAHYGNAVGVPTVGGEWHELPAYAGNPLVNCLCAGIVAEDRLLPSAIPSPGLALVLLGAPTGRDGVGGAAFASRSLSGEDDRHRVEVQVGDPFQGKLLVEATLAAAEEGALVGLGDLGAAGLTSAVAEMAHRGGVGVLLELDRVPLREAGMAAAEILLSESQERMLLVVPPEREPAVEAVARRFGIHGAVVGHSDGSGRLVVRHRGRVVADLPVGLLAAGCPPAPLAPRPRPATAPRPVEEDPAWLFDRLAAVRPPGGPRDVYRRFDWSVGIRTVLPPGHDAAVLRLFETGGHVALVTKSAPHQAALNPRAGAALAVAWAAEALAAVGARPLGLTDGLNLGDPDDPHVAWEIEETVAGIASAARALDLPVIGGNVSLYNRSPEGSVPPTAVVGGVGVLSEGEPVGRSVPPGPARVALVGSPAGGLSGSLAQLVAHGSGTGPGAAVDLAASRRLIAFLRDAWLASAVVAAHVVDAGGLLLAAWQMAAGAGLGLAVGPELTRAEAFGEGAGRAVVAFPPAMAETLSRLSARHGLPFTILGDLAPGPFRAVVEGRSVVLGGGGAHVR